MYQKGHLPDRGAVSEQSASLLEAFRILDDENEACNQVLEEQARKKQARDARAKARGAGKSR